MSLVILAVCHANHCRSPMAELLLRRAIDNRFGEAAASVTVHSAGTEAWAGKPMHPYAAEVMREHGIEPLAFRSRRLSPDLVSQADLVLTATRKQRAFAVAMDPAAVKRTFTLPQFGRLAHEVSVAGMVTTGSPVERLRSVTESIPMVRGHLSVPPIEDDEIADPVWLPLEGFRRCAGAIDRVVEVMTGLIAPS